MAFTSATVCDRAGRSAAALTRRDVMLALLTVPAEQAMQALPEIRQTMLRAGNPLSRTFWDGVRATLASIADGRATVGAVHRWLQATGTEPMHLVGDGFVWPDEDERGPVAHEMHTLLVEHLERLVAEGVVDPDRWLPTTATRGMSTRRRRPPG
ncbi:hypothetical protein BH23ACT10_BH23ACT10_02250 [soil metagenome]